MSSDEELATDSPLFCTLLACSSVYWVPLLVRVKSPGLALTVSFEAWAKLAVPLTVRYGVVGTTLSAKCISMPAPLATLRSPVIVVPGAERFNEPALTETGAMMRWPTKSAWPATFTALKLSRSPVILPPVQFSVARLAASMAVPALLRDLAGLLVDFKRRGLVPRVHQDRRAVGLDQATVDDAARAPVCGFKVKVAPRRLTATALAPLASRVPVLSR